MTAGQLESLAERLRGELVLSGTSVHVSEGEIRVVRGEDVVVIAEAARLLPTVRGGSGAAGRGGLGRGLAIALEPPSQPALRTLIDAGVYDVAEPPVDPLRLSVTVRNALDLLAMRQRVERKAEQLARQRYELAELIDIARTISSERQIDALLDTVLRKCRYISSADAGSIYIVEGSGPLEKRSLRFKLAQNDSSSVEGLSEFAFPLSRASMAGAAALDRRVINVPDVYALRAEGALHHDTSFDRRTGYKTRSMLVAPMIAQDDEVIGVVQLINRKVDPSAPLLAPRDFEKNVVPFDARSEELVRALAAHAAVSLENAMLTAGIQAIFEGFVTASMHAIEQRDPTTSGHSERVAALTCELARLVNDDEGRFAEVRFCANDLEQLRYAALLHDFGKIGVREDVLVKEKKLPPRVLERLELRFEAARLSLRLRELELERELRAAGAAPEEVEGATSQLRSAARGLVEGLEAIGRANEPGPTEPDLLGRIQRLAGQTYRDASGSEVPLLSPDELRYLTIRSGSLTDEEFQEIRSHARKTKEYLSRIPWGKAFSDLPEIAGAHHERLDGTGYPDGLKGTQVSIQARMMSVADIFDALTAADRPYKKAMPIETALAVLDDEVEQGHLDPDVVRLFKAAQAFRVVRHDKGT